MVVTLANAKAAGQVSHKQTVFAVACAWDYGGEMDLAAAITRRRRNLRRLSDEMGQEELAHRLGISGSYVSQLCTATRPITEKTARKFEAALGQPVGWFDVDHDALHAAESPAAADKLINLLLSLSEEEREFWVRTIRDAPRKS